MLEKKLKEFFKTHPEATVVFVALGTLFTDLDKAIKYLAGVTGKSVETFTRQQVVTADDDELQKLIVAAEKELEEKKNAENELAAINAIESKQVQELMDAPHEAPGPEGEKTKEEET